MKFRARLDNGLRGARSSSSCEGTTDSRSGIPDTPTSRKVVNAGASQISQGAGKPNTWMPEDLAYNQANAAAEVCVRKGDVRGAALASWTSSGYRPGRRSPRSSWDADYIATFRRR
eukprot:scaffold1474_cov256-Pinguiococcus_pyrenoidosus.AAC.27